MSKTNLTRRTFAAGLSATPALLAQQPTGVPPQPQPQQRRGPRPEVPPFQGAIEFTRNDVAPKVHPFALTQVKLLSGAYHDAQEWNRGYMRRLDAPRLLYNFRQNAGLPTGTVDNPFGGWEAPADSKRGTEL